MALTYAVRFLVSLGWEAGVTWALERPGRSLLCMGWAIASLDDGVNKASDCMRLLWL